MAVLTLVFSTQDAHAAEKDDLLASFIYNLVDYINWKDKKAVAICTYGYDDVTASLTEINAKKRSEARPSSGAKKRALHINTPFDQLPSCDLIYVAPSEKRNVFLLFESIKNAPIVTVSSIENFVMMGGDMEFKVMRRKVQLKVGQQALERTGITVSPVILMSAKPTSTKHENVSPE